MQQHIINVYNLHTGSKQGHTFFTLSSLHHTTSNLFRVRSSLMGQRLVNTNQHRQTTRKYLNINFLALFLITKVVEG